MRGAAKAAAAAAEVVFAPAVMLLVPEEDAEDDADEEVVDEDAFGDEPELAPAVGAPPGAARSMAWRAAAPAPAAAASCANKAGEKGDAPPAGTRLLLCLRAARTDKGDARPKGLRGALERAAPAM
jgi:hypothetical protein